MAGRWKRMTYALALACAMPAVMGGDSPEASAQEWEVENDRTEEIIERYKIMLEENPTEGMALSRLLGYVGRGAGLERLIEEYERKLEGQPEANNFRLILGHLHKEKGNLEEAKAYYGAVMERRPSEPLGWLGRGTISLMEGDRVAAMADFQEALEREQNRERRMELLRQLGELSFGQRDLERGKEFYERLIAMRPSDEFLRMEYVRLLVQYRQFEDALGQYDRLDQMAGRDNRKRAQILRDRAEVYEMMDEMELAIETYEEVLSMVSSSSWIATEVRQNMVDAFRRAGRLLEFLEGYGASWSRGTAEQQMSVADVYTEIGQLEDALGLYRQIRSRERSDTESRRKIIRVLERLGRSEEIVAAYEDLIRAAPGQQQFAFDLARYHIRQGDRGQARKVLDRVGTRFRDDAFVLLELADYYARWNFEEEARQTYETVLAREGQDDAVLIEAGDFYFERGERERAFEIWAGLVNSRLGEVAGKERLADLYLERGIINRGLELFEELLERRPEDERLLRALARGLERARRYEEALSAWERVLASAPMRQRRQEARARIVEIHQRQNTLQAAMRHWEEAMAEDDDDGLNGAFFLVEAYLRLREFERAETVLEALVERDGLDSDDRASVYLLLEQTYVRAGRYPEAIEVLRSLIVLRPDMERELLDRMADHALEGRAGDDAIAFAREVLEANPDDARAQARMGDIQRRAGNREEAIQHYQTAVEIDHRAFDVQLKLGELLLEMERISEGQVTLMQVVQNADDDQLIQDAGARLLAMAKREGRLMALESQWSNLVFRLPVRAVHARLVMDLYEAMAGPLVFQAVHGDEGIREASMAALYAIGGRATTLLVDQVQSDDRSLQVRALRLIGAMRVDAAVSLVARLIDDPEEDVRKMALVTAARLGAPAFVEPIRRRLGDGSAEVRHLAIWALGFIDDEAAEEELLDLAAAGFEGTAAHLAWRGLAGFEGTKVERFIGSILEEGPGEDGALDEQALELVFSVAENVIVAGGGRGFAGPLMDLVLARGERSAVRAAELLSELNTEVSRKALWQFVFHENPSVARAGERGLVRMERTSSRERSVEREALFFDWSRSEFDASKVVSQRSVENVEEAGRGRDIFESGVVEAIREVEPARRVPRLLERMEADREKRFWTRERQVAVARLVRTEIEGGAERAVLLLLSGERLEGLEFVTRSEQELELIYRAIAVHGEVPFRDVEALLEAGFDHENPDVHAGVLAALLGIQEIEEASAAVNDVVVRGLESGDAVREIRAVRLVGMLGITSARSRLEAMEPTASPGLRREIREARRELSRSLLDRSANSF